jgi:3',5'-cyclic AMP phosphodiesterase CpdA
MLIAQISDTHIKPEGVLAYGRVDTAAFLAGAVAHINALDPRPDLVLATGDLVDAGLAAEYARLRALLAPLAMPVYLIPGNHDARDPLRAAFPEHAYLPGTGFLQYVVEGHAMRLLALDTLTPGKGHGELCAERLDWLAARLAESDRPTVLFMHHPPFECGIAYMDGERLRAGAGELEAIVRRHPNVERVLCGHVHRPIQIRWAGTLASVAPPAVALHQWRPGTGLVTHLSFIGDYGGPQPFRLPAA